MKYFRIIFLLALILSGAFCLVFTIVRMVQGNCDALLGALWCIIFALAIKLGVMCLKE